MQLAFFSPGDASVIVAVIAAIAGAIAQRNRRDIKMINRAVNHQGADHPTLIQRVIRLEAQRGNARVKLEWPIQAADACGAWLREWLA